MGSSRVRCGFGSSLNIVTLGVRSSLDLFEVGILNSVVNLVLG